jgi:hypothetical protein
VAVILHHRAAAAALANKTYKKMDNTSSANTVIMVGI